MAKEIFCAFGVDVDAVAGWLGSYGGEDSPEARVGQSGVIRALASAPVRAPTSRTSTSTETEPSGAWAQR